MQTLDARRTRLTTFDALPLISLRCLYLSYTCVDIAKIDGLNSLPNLFFVMGDNCPWKEFSVQNLASLQYFKKDKVQFNWASAQQKIRTEQR